MTREDAIRELKIFSGTTKTRLSANFWKALEMAIKALSEEPCEDAVSRRAVLNTLDKMDSVLDEDRTVETYKELLVACYNDLPSVNDKGGCVGAKMICTCCGKDNECGRKLNYCPNCGAKIESEEK